MEPRSAHDSLNISDNTEGDFYYRRETLHGNDEQESEKFFLLHKHSKLFRRAPGRKHIIFGVLTTLNVILFLTSITTLFLSPKAKSTTDQDHWRATSFYCTSSPSPSQSIMLPLTPHEPQSLTASSSRNTTLPQMAPSGTPHRPQYGAQQAPTQTLPGNQSEATLHQFS